MFFYQARNGRWMLLAAAFASQSVFAHPGVHEDGFTAGAGHPLSGLDHILAMLAVGLWAFQLTGRARWLLPLVFVGTMIAGGALGISGVAIPLVENGIVASVLVLGLLTACAPKPSLRIAVPIVALCALFHGHAHGAELPEGASGLSYAAGFVLSTTLLHLSGLALAFAAALIQYAKLARVAGGAIACCAVMLWAGWL